MRAFTPSRLHSRERICFACTYKTKNNFAIPIQQAIFLQRDHPGVRRPTSSQIALLISSTEDVTWRQLNSGGHRLYRIWSWYPEETKTNQSYYLKLQIVVTISITVCDKLYHYNVFHKDELMKTKAEPVGRMTEHPEACGQWDMGKLVRMLITKAYGPTVISPL